MPPKRPFASGCSPATGFQALAITALGPGEDGSGKRRDGAPDLLPNPPYCVCVSASHPPPACVCAAGSLAWHAAPKLFVTAWGRACECAAACSRVCACARSGHRPHRMPVTPACSHLRRRRSARGALLAAVRGPARVRRARTEEETAQKNCGRGYRRCCRATGDRRRRAGGAGSGRRA